MDRTLAKNLAFVLLLKLVLLLSLWWGFFREQRVTVDADNVGLRLLQAVSAPTQEVAP